MRYTLVYLFLLCLVFFESINLNAQLHGIPKMIAVNDTLFVGQFEITNNDFHIFFENQNDSVKKALINRRQLFYNEYNGSQDFSLGDIEVYSTHPSYGNYPFVGISQEDAELYISWIQKLDSTKSYFIPSRFDYLAIYSIRVEEAVLSKFLGKLPICDPQAIKATIDSGSTFNRDYFPWGVSIYGPKNKILANLLVPVEYRVLMRSKSFIKRKWNSKNFYFNGVMAVGSMPYQYKKIYDLQGNVSELLFESNFSFGGSFIEEASSGYIGRVTAKKAVPFDVGFRIFAKKFS